MVKSNTFSILAPWWRRRKPKRAQKLLFPPPPPPFPLPLCIGDPMGGRRKCGERKSPQLVSTSLLFPQKEEGKIRRGTPGGFCFQGTERRRMAQCRGGGRHLPFWYNAKKICLQYRVCFPHADGQKMLFFKRKTSSEMVFWGSASLLKWGWGVNLKECGKDIFGTFPLRLDCFFFLQERSFPVWEKHCTVQVHT